MRKFLPILLLMVTLAAASASAQDGPWSGSLDVRGTKLLLIFNIDGEIVTLDVPDQGGKGVPANLSRTPEGKLVIVVPSIGAKYEGIMLPKMIAGTFSQSGMEFPLTLRPGAPKPKRPQTPVGPFPYKSEEVTFTNGDVVLSGTLTLQEGCGPETTALVMVTGSGLQDRNEELFDHKPFAVIADALARGGIATLRYDDRGYGKSTGNAGTATTLDSKADAEAGLELLRTRFGRVGILGHSEGGTIALLLAGEKKVDFAVSLAGMFISGVETLLDQNRHSLSQAGIPAEDVEKYVNALASAFDAVLTGTPLPTPGAVPEALRANFAAVLMQIQTVYMRNFLTIDVVGSTAAVECPVLALNGTMDMQVSAAKNLPAIKPLLKSEKSLVAEQSGLNHLFQHCTTGDVSEYRTIEETISPDVLKLIVEWIQKL